ncbi:SPW repeat domain-containing protein [Sinorhizobium kostiense]
MAASLRSVEIDRENPTSFIYAAFKFGGLPAADWNAGIVGTLIVCSSAVALIRYGGLDRMVQPTLGVLATAAPFPLGFGSEQVAT